MKSFSTLLLAVWAVNLSAQLSGTLTVGGLNPDYATLTDAVNDLMNQGATGNVTFDIRPGTYTGQYTLGTVPGATGAITFRNSSNGAQAVDLQYLAGGTSDNYIFRVDGTDNVRFEKLTFRPLDPVHARAIHFFNAIAGITIEQCVFHGSTNAAGAGYQERILVHCDQFAINTDDNPQDVLILDNSFFDGNTAIEIDAYGSNGARSQGLIISGNEFRQQIGTGVRLNHCVGSIGDNAFSTTVGAWYVGIRTTFFDGGSQIRRNRIEAVATTGGCTGIECGNTQNTTGNMISNNMVYCSAPGDVWGMAVYNLWDMKIVHNSVLVAEANPFQSHAFYHVSLFADGQDALVRNNIFANNAGGYAYFVPLAANVATEDHNCLFTTGPTLSSVGGSQYPDIVAHQNGTGLGQGDTDIDPVFPLQPDLHLNGCTNDLVGAYFFVVATDIDGDARGNPVCDMGADEFTYTGNAVLPTITILDTDLPYTLGLGASFATYTWSTGETTPTILITSGGTYTVGVTDANGCQLTLTVTVVVDLATGVAGPQRPTPVLYPNPAMDVLQVAGVAPGVTYTVLDAQGRCVLNGTTTGNTTIAVEGLATGMHLLRWDGGGTLRFLKH